MKRLVEVNGRRGILDFSPSGEFTLAWDDGSETAGSVDAREVSPGVWSFLWNGESYEAVIEPNAVIVDGERLVASAHDPRDWSPAGGDAGAHGPQQIVAPMPGKIVRVLVSVGDEVQAGQGIAVVEAMKMQNEMQSPRAGRVSEMRAAAGETVAAGDVLATIE